MPEFRLSDGALIAYEDVGQGRPLLLIHGWATHAGFFAPQLEGLADQFRVIAPDLRCHGRSRACPGTPDLDRMARDLVELAAALDLRDLLAVGWSMGAMVVWAALAGGLAPRAAGLVSIDMAPKVLNSLPDWPHGLRGSHSGKPTPAALEIMEKGWAGLAPRIAARIFASGREAEQAILRRWAEREIAESDPRAMARLWADLTARDDRALLPGLRLPALIIHGRLSRLYPASTADALARLLPLAETLGFDQSGHAPHLEEPARFNAVIRDFAARLAPIQPRAGPPAAERQQSA